MINPAGIGIIMAARQPSKVPAHWMPRLLNICLAKRGNTEPIAERRMVFAAKTDAAL
jgi:hypothetical protein